MLVVAVSRRDNDSSEPSQAGGASATNYGLSVGIMPAGGLCMARAPASFDVVHGHGHHMSNI